MNYRIAFFVLLMIFVLMPCGSAMAAAEKFTGKLSYSVLKSFKFDFPRDWKVRTKENPFDLQCVSRQEDATTGIFVFSREDIGDDGSADDIFKAQIEDLRSKRKGFKLIETARPLNTGGKKIKTSVYSGTRNGMKNYYIFSLIEFEKYDKFAVVLQTCFPSDYVKYGPVLKEIVESCKPAHYDRAVPKK